MPTPAGPRPSDVPAPTLEALCRLVGAEPLAGGGSASPARTSPTSTDVTSTDATSTDPRAVRVTGVTLDSRRVLPGDLYAALPGARAHGADFVEQVAAAGAVALLTDAEGARRAAPYGLPALVVDHPRAVLGRLAAAVYGEPADRLAVLGVTGTNGKTTTTYLLEAALRSVGRTTGVIGTVEIRIGDERVPSARTTPESPDLHALLGVMVERGVDTCAMEVSSHALAQHRVDGVVYDVAGFTNLSQDHLDFHAGMEEYYATKATLFTPERSRRGVVVVDDEWGRRLAGEATVPVVTVSTTAADADWCAHDPRVSADGATTAFRLRHRDGTEVEAVSPLPGGFNVANTALALVMLVESGVPADEAARGLAAAPGVPGRMERVRAGAPDEPLALVDYAHTPDAVEAALGALRGSTAGRLVIVLGAGGDRDAGKRRAMGAAAAQGADLVVVTDDNPRSEDPGTIRAAVLAGAHDAAGDHVQVLEVGDRAEAVLAAVRATTGPQDTVLVAGKGHEQGQDVAGTVYPFDDRGVLRAALERVAAERTHPEEATP